MLLARALGIGKATVCRDLSALQATEPALSGKPHLAIDYDESMTFWRAYRQNGLGNEQPSHNLRFPLAQRGPAAGTRRDALPGKLAPERWPSVRPESEEQQTAEILRQSASLHRSPHPPAPPRRTACPPFAGLRPFPAHRDPGRRSRHTGRAQTELAAVLPFRVVTAWCGNTPNVALRHYLMTTDDHLDLASSLDVTPKTVTKKPARNPAQCTSELGSTGRAQRKNPSKFQRIPRGSSLFRLRNAQERTRTSTGEKIPTRT